MTGSAGQTGTPLGVCGLGALQVCWGVQPPSGGSGKIPEQIETG
jgi:hypothetical protein